MTFWSLFGYSETLRYQQKNAMLQEKCNTWRRETSPNLLHFAQLIQGLLYLGQNLVGKLALEIGHVLRLNLQSLDQTGQKRPNLYMLTVNHFLTWFTPCAWLIRVTVMNLGGS
jgi:hypothetical protein